MTGTENKFGISQEDIEKFQTAQDQALKDQAKDLFAAVVNDFGGQENFAEEMLALDRAVKAALPPDLLMELNAAEAEIAATQAKGGKFEDHPELFQRLADVMENPAYAKAMDEAMYQMLAQENPRPDGDTPVSAKAQLKP